MTARGPSEGAERSPLSAATMNSNQRNSDGCQAVAVSDPQLAQLVAEALRRTGHSALGGLQVSTQLGVVTLRGHVPNSYLKVLAMTTALTVSGAWWVVNCLDVSVCSTR